MFIQTKVDLRPYYYSLPTFLIKYSSLLNLVGVAEFPSSKDLIKLLKQLSSKNPGKRLNPNQLMICLRVLPLLAKLKEVEGVMVPNKDAILKPATDLAFVDMIDLTDRICVENIDTVHQWIPNGMAR
jgi:hypothetical protein